MDPHDTIWDVLKRGLLLFIIIFLYSLLFVIGQVTIANLGASTEAISEMLNDTVEEQEGTKQNKINEIDEVLIINGVKYIRE